MKVVSLAELQIPGKAWHHLEQASTALQRNQPDVAEREAARALAAAPRFGQAYLLRAIVAVRTGHFEAAREAAEMARQIEPGLPWTAVVLAGALNQLHRYDDAVASLEQAHGEEAESWQASYERARAETGRGNTAAALHWSDAAVNAAPAGCTQARLVRANALELAGRHAEVVAEWENYLRENRSGTHRDEVLLAIKRATEESEPHAER